MKRINYLESISKHVNPICSRPYKGGLELRGVNMDIADQQINAIIKAMNWPVEVFEKDYRVRSVSIRLKNESNET